MSRIIFFPILIGITLYACIHIKPSDGEAEQWKLEAHAAISMAEDAVTLAEYWKSVADSCRGTVEIHPQINLRTRGDTLAGPLENTTSTGAQNSLPAMRLGGGAGGLVDR